MKQGGYLVLILVALALLLALALTGCGPKQPDRALILWEQPAPEIAARAHAREIGGLPYHVVGRSMEPFLVEGDWIAADARIPFSSLQKGDVIVYQPDWYTGLVVHMVAAKSGEGWIMDGVNNAHYEGAANNAHVFKQHYRAKMVQGYTRRSKA